MKKEERRIFLLRVDNGTVDVTCKLVWVPGYALNRIYVLTFHLKRDKC